LEHVVLTARVVTEGDRYIARVDQLPLEGHGGSVKQAQDQLVQVVRGWIESQDAAGKLPEALAQAGIPGVEEDTEVQLEFVE